MIDLKKKKCDSIVLGSHPFTSYYSSTLGFGAGVAASLIGQFMLVVCASRTNNIIVSVMSSIIMIGLLVAPLGFTQMLNLVGGDDTKKNTQFSTGGYIVGVVTSSLIGIVLLMCQRNQLFLGGTGSNNFALQIILITAVSILSVFTIAHSAVGIATSEKCKKLNQNTTSQGLNIPGILLGIAGLGINIVYFLRACNYKGTSIL